MPRLKALQSLKNETITVPNRAALLQFDLALREARPPNLWLMLTAAAAFNARPRSWGMGYLIKYIKDGDFVGTDIFVGSLAEATIVARAGLTKRSAEFAAVMDEADLDGEPKALLEAST